MSQFVTVSSEQMMMQFHPKELLGEEGRKDSKSVENILVEDCVFWVDFANVSELLRKVVVRLYATLRP